MSEVMQPNRVAGVEDGRVDEFCHIEMEDDGANYCGVRTSGDSHGPDYAGEAVCPTCGLSTCPTCAQMESLDARLEG